jgi:DnaJ-class molecular chaperone
MEKPIKCEECNGTGTVEFYTNEGDYSREFDGDCPECNGSGEIKPFKFFEHENENI